MADRYIDAEKIKYHQLSVCEGHGLNFEYTVAYKHEVDAIPTADVVPKSEVEKIFKEFERLMENNEVWFRQTDEIREDFSKLKKKYIGEE